MKNKLKISLWGYTLLSTIVILLNYKLTPSVNWAFAPVILTLWWPLGVYFSINKSMKFLSVVGTIINIFFFVGLNYIYSPQYLWSLYVIFPMIIWPVMVWFKMSKRLAWLCFIVISCYYVGLNLFYEDRHPFAIYIVYSLFWWPFSISVPKSKNRKAVAFLGSVLNIVALYAMNQIVKPEYFWSIYVFAPLLWWPICEVAGAKAKTKWFAWLSFFLLVSYYGFVNLYIETRHPYIIYVVFSLIWWPLGVSYSGHRNHLLFSIEGFSVISVFLFILNIITTPNLLWSVIPILLLSVWPLVFLVKSLKVKKNY